MIISLRLDDKVGELLKLYSHTNGLTMSEMVRETLIKRVEQDYLRLVSEAEKEEKEREKYYQKQSVGF